MSKKTTVVIYILLAIIVFAAIFIIWAIDTGKIASHADVPSGITSAQDLQTLPNPDQSTFSKIFGRVAGWFSR